MSSTLMQDILCSTMIYPLTEQTESGTVKPWLQHKTYVIIWEDVIKIVERKDEFTPVIKTELVEVLKLLDAVKQKLFLDKMDRIEIWKCGFLLISISRYTTSEITALLNLDQFNKKVAKAVRCHQVAKSPKKKGEMSVDDMREFMKVYQSFGVAREMTSSIILFVIMIGVMGVFTLMLIPRPH